ncbi:MAG TPA: hypothetical protein EYP14_14360, partial [Planctomycetaceae bacterium]|nr:hypothetical protein [Planctomycetaceae bacterium]
MRIVQTRRVDSLFERWSLNWHPQSQTLLARDGLGRLRWGLRLPEGAFAVPYTGSYFAASSGHVLLLALGDRFVVLDTLGATPPADDAQRTASHPPTILWGRMLLELPAGRAGGRFVRGRPIMRPGGGHRILLTDPRGRAVGTVAAITSDLVCYQVGDTLYAADLLTGQVVWWRKAVPRGSEIFGDEQQVVLVSPETDAVTFLRTTDGVLLGHKRYPGSRLRLGTIGHCLLTWQLENDRRQLAKYDLLEDKALWQREFAAEALIATVGEDELAVVEPSGRVTILRCDDGTTVLQGTVPNVRGATQAFVIRSAERYILITTALDNTSPVQVGGLPYLTHQAVVNGRVDGFSRRSGEHLWSFPLQQTTVDLEQPRDLPVLVFACRCLVLPAKPNARGLPPAVPPKYSLLILDTRNGTVIFRDDDYLPIQGYRVEADKDRQTIRVITDRTTVTLR